MPEVTTDELARQRQLIEERLNNMRGFFQTNQAAQDLSGFFGGSMAQGLQGQLQDRASGANSPFSPDLIASLIGGSTSANARGVSRDSDMIRRSMANSGMSGSGLETNALVNSRRQATAGNVAARRDITSRAQLENFQARERAQGQVQSFLQQQLQAQQQLVESQRNQSNQADQSEIGFREQFREITPSGSNGAGGTGAGGDWISRWNSAQAEGLTRRANGINLGIGGAQGTPWSGAQVAQGVQDQRFAQDRLNQLLAFGG